MDDTKAVERLLNIAGGAVELTEVQSAALLTESGLIERTIAALSGTDSRLTEAQRASLTTASSEIKKTISAVAGDDLLTPDQRLTLTSSTSTINKTVAALAGSDALTPDQRRVLTASTSRIDKTVSALAGTDGNLTTAQRAVLSTATGNITKTVSAVGGTDTLTPAQQTLLGILRGTTGGEVTVRGSVDYAPADDLSTLFDDLTIALGRVGVQEMTAELGRLTAAIAAQMAATDAEKSCSRCCET